MECRRCPDLCASRQTIVYPDWPDGRPCRLLVIGEAPGSEEDALGKGFVGRAGRTLHRLLEAQGWHRGVDYGCANIVRCRPPQNRPPTAAEIGNCLPYLAETLERARPAALLLVGGTATSVFCGSGSLGKHLDLLRREENRLPQGFCPPDLRGVLESDGAPRVFAMPHTSPLAWNRNAPDGRRWRDVGMETVKRLAAFLRRS